MCSQLKVPHRESAPGWLLALLAGFCLLGPQTVLAQAPGSTADPRTSAPRTDTVALEVRVEGVEDELLDNVLNFLSIHRFAEEGELPAAWIRRLHARAPEEISEALQPFGHYRAEVAGELTDDAVEWTAVYRINPGDRVKVAVVDLRISGEGAETEPFVEAREEFPLAPGDVLLHQRYESGRRRFGDLAAQLGYFDAVFERRQVEVDLESYTASIFIDFHTGPRYLFGDVSFVHDDLVEDRLLHAPLKFEQGDPFDRRKLRSLQVALTDTAFFRSVEIESLQDESESLEVPIRITLAPAKRGRYNFGLGYGTETGIRGQFRWNFRRINRRGHSATVWLRASERETSFTTNYRIPLPRPDVERLEFVVRYGEWDTDSYVTTGGRAGVGTSRTFGRWRQVGSIGVQTDDYVVGPDVGETEHLVPGLSFEFIEADDRIVPNLGVRLRLDARGASREVLSDNSFFQFTAAAKAVVGFGPDGKIGRRHRLLTRLDLGWLATGDFRLLPPDFRFFTGGDQSIRGFGYKAVGGTDESSEVIGGDSLAVGSLEYEYRFTDSIGSALFIDGGMAGQTASEKLAIGTGVGVRLRTPIGPVRLDVAWAISEPDDPLRVHLSIGPDL